MNRSQMSIFENKKLVILFLEEGRKAAALFAGFSLVLFAIPFSQSPSIYDYISIGVVAASTTSLVCVSYYITFFVTWHRAKIHEKEFELSAFDEEVTPYISKFLLALLVGAIGLFITSVVMACFRIHWGIGFAAIFSPLIIAIFTYLFIKVLKRHNI